MIKQLSRLLALSLCFVMSFTAMIRPAEATLVSTAQVAQEAHAVPAASAARERLLQSLQRPELQAKLQQWGVSPAQAADRVNALTDDEAQAMVAQIDSAPAGGDVLGILFAIFIILLVTDILGLTKVFPFTRSVR
ncbi:MAG: PA2779 family protein [Betaproteobacteria bacterium]|nr:PA2779 family protein [Betaproteobacteria bacterium]MDE2048998.1 PA2779 family protein [Betaproteobacteria bacterium]